MRFRVECAKNHGYVAVESLTKHDEVLSLSSYKFEKIIKICRLNISTDFYLITVEPYHNFFISEIGVLTHNSDTFLFGIGGASVPLAASGTIGWIVLIPAAATLALWYHLGCKHEAEVKAKLKAEEESKKRRFSSDLFEASIEASERENKRREIEKEAERAKAAKNNFDPENIVSTKLDFIIDGYGRKKAQFFITNKAGGIKVAELGFFTPPYNIDFCEADFSELQNFLFKKNKPSIKGSNDGNKNGPGGGGPNGPKDHKYNWWIKLQEDLDKKSNQLLSLKNNFLQKVFPVKQDNLYLLIGTLFVYYSVVTNAFSIACKCAEIAGLKAPTVTAEDAAKSAIKRDAELVDIAKDQLEVAKEQAKEQREHNAAMLEIARDKTAQEQFSKINTLVDKVVSSKFENPELIEECNQAFEEILSNNDNPLLPMNDAQKKSLSSLSAEIRNSFFSQR